MNSKHRARRIPRPDCRRLPAWVALALGALCIEAAVAQVPSRPSAASAVASPARQAPVYDVSRIGLGASLPVAPGVAVAPVASGVAVAPIAPVAPVAPVAPAAPGSAAAVAEAPASSPSSADTGLGADLQTQIRQMVASGTQAFVKPGSGITRVDVELGMLDPRLRLAPCAKVEPYLPNGMRLAGRSRIGLRCLEGTTRWNVYMPITVKIFGPALVAAQPLQAGTVLSEADLRTAEIDLAEDVSPAMTQLQAVVGRTLARPMTTGQGLRQVTLKSRQWFAAGDTVAIDAVGDGFAVAGEGQAMTPGIEGLPAKVRTESGRIVTGLPVSQRRLQVRLQE